MQVPNKRERRGWRVLIPRHSTVAAYTALILATGGTAAAATGGTFLLGKANTATATSGLTTTGTGVALSLKTHNGTAAPLSVNSKTQVTNLNASYLGGLPASSFGSVESASISLPGVSCTPCTVELYGPVSGVSTGSAAESSADTLTPDVPTFARDLSVQFSTAPTYGTSIVLVIVNDATAVLACQVGGTATTCTNDGPSPSIPAGSRISILVEEISPELGFPVPAANVMVGLTLAPA